MRLVYIGLVCGPVWEEGVSIILIDMGRPSLDVGSVYWQLLFLLAWLC